MTPLALLCYWLSFLALEINRSFLILFKVNMLITMLVPNNEFSLAVHTYDFHIFTVIYSSLHRFIWDQHSDQLPIGLIAQLVMGLWVQIPYRADFFFRPYFHYCSSSIHYCEDCCHIYVFVCSSYIWFSYIHSH